MLSGIMQLFLVPLSSYLISSLNPLLIFFASLLAQILKVIIVLAYYKRVTIKPITPFFEEILLHMPIPYFRFAKLTGYRSKHIILIKKPRVRKNLIFTVSIRTSRSVELNKRSYHIRKEFHPR